MKRLTIGLVVLLFALVLAGVVQPAPERGGILLFACIVLGCLVWLFAALLHFYRWLLK